MELDNDDDDNKDDEDDKFDGDDDDDIDDDDDDDYDDHDDNDDDMLLIMMTMMMMTVMMMMMMMMTTTTNPTTTTTTTTTLDKKSKIKQIKMKSGDGIFLLLFSSFFTLMLIFTFIERLCGLPYAGYCFICIFSFSLNNISNRGGGQIPKYKGEKVLVLGQFLFLI